jgi:hypothetical protein
MTNNVGDPQDSGTLSPVVIQTINGAVNNSTSVTLAASNASIAVGQVVTGAGIPAANGITGPTTVTAVSGTSLTLSQAATLADKTPLTFLAYSNQNIAVDFVWKNVPIQPNDDRAATITNTGGVITGTITAAVGNGSTVTYTATNTLSAGQVINISGLATTSVTIPTAGNTSPGTGSVITLATGAAHNFVPGQAITLTGLVPIAYNGTYIAQSGTTGSTIVVNGSATGAITTAGASFNNMYNGSSLVVASATSSSFTVNSIIGNNVSQTGQSGTFTTVGDKSWSSTTKVASARIDPTLSYQGIVDSAWGNYPAAADYKSTITGVSADGTYVIYTGQNNYAVGQVISVSGLTNSALNLNAQTIVAAGSTYFIVANSAASGVTLTGQSGTAVAQYLDQYNYQVTAVSGNGTTVTYTAQNTLRPGQSVNITGLTNGVFNLSNATVATANANYFTVTSAVGSGISLTGQTGKAENSNALSNFDGAYQSGTFYIAVPNVVGQTLASALDGLQDRGLALANISAAATTSAASKSVTLITRTAGSTNAVLTAATHGFVVGDVVTIASSTVAGLNGDRVVLHVPSASTFVVASDASQTGVATSGTATAIGKVGTVHATTPAAGTASVSTSSTLTYSLWA